MVSEVHNVDCVEYMRTLPDNHFDIAICDPPYGDAENGNFVMGGGDLEVGSTATSNRLRFHGGDRWNRYYKPQITPPLISRSQLESTRKVERGRQSTSDRQIHLRRQIQPTFIVVVAERKNTTKRMRASYNALIGILHQRKNFGTSFSA